jgi:hypothetical protein
LTIYDTGGYIGELAGSLTGVYSYTHEERSQLYRGFVHSVEEDRRGEYIFQMIANMVSFGVPSLLDTGIRHGVGSEEFGEGVGSSVISAGISYGSVRASGGNLYTIRQPLVRGRVQEGLGYQPRGPVEGPGYQPRGPVKGPGYQPRGPVEGPGYQPRGPVEGPGYQPGGSAGRCAPRREPITVRESLDLQDARNALNDPIHDVMQGGAGRTSALEKTCCTTNTLNCAPR